MADVEILNIKEVAVLLRVAEETAYTLAQTGEFPGFEVNGQWRFRRRDIDAWIDAPTARPSCGGGTDR